MTGARRAIRSHARVWRALAGLAALAMMAGILGSGLALPLVAVAASTVDAGNTAFTSLPADIPTLSLPQTTVVLDARGHVIAHLYDENRTQVPLSAMSVLVQHAIVAVEDSRFFQHGPVDPRGLARALVADATGHPIQGASTLTQQYAKNLLLEQDLLAGDTAGAKADVARTVSRKVRELRLAVSLEQHYTKQQILQRYLNIVYFGQGAYGVQAAAERFFGVPAAKLDLAQAATLAGLVQDPAAYDPVQHPGAARQRRDEVLTDMRAQAMITTAQYSRAVATKVRVTGTAAPEGCAASGTTGFFCDYVVQSLLRDPAFAALGATAGQRQQALLNGGLVIHTTLDPSTQSAAVHAVDASVPPTDASRLGAAAVTVEPGTGAVVAMAENRTFSPTAGRGRTSVNYTTDASLGGASGFQTGSSFKPFTLATWLEQGRSLYDVVDATKRGFPFSSFASCGQPLSGTQPYLPGNSEGTETGPMSVLDATVNSVNVAYVDMETQLDLCTVAKTAEALGVHTATAQQVCTVGAAASTDLPTCLPSLTLGVEDIAPLTMAAAYAGFASGGTYCAPMPVGSITSRASPGAKETTVLTAHPSCRQALSGAVASGVNTALEQVLTRGTAAGTGPLFPWQSAGKTGTTDGPYDSWFVGYTAQRSTAVWVGDPGRTVHGKATRLRLTNVMVGGTYYPVVYGASIAAPIWKRLMTSAMAGLPATALP